MISSWHTSREWRNRLNPNSWIVGMNRHSNRHTAEAVQDAFKILMTHWILQFAWRIAFRCVLHRCGNQDIRCWKCLPIFFSQSPEWFSYIQVYINDLTSHPRVDSKSGLRRARNGLVRLTNQHGLILKGQAHDGCFGVVMILPQVHLRKPCYDFTFL